MPAGNGTGPMGMGPMTGRAAGVCAGFDMPGYGNPIPGRGFGMGCGRGRGGRGGSRGRGFRNMFHATGMTGWQRAAAECPIPGGMPPYAAPTREQELKALNVQAESLENALADIRTRLQDMETQTAQK